jgi:hypothetical protein
MRIDIYLKVVPTIIAVMLTRDRLQAASQSRINRPRRGTAGGRKGEDQPHAWRESYLRASRIGTSYIEKASSAVTMVSPSSCACAMSIRSNGSLW